MKGIVLSSGKGKKIWPLGEWRPKTSLPVLNQPIVERLVEQLGRLGIEEIVVVASYQAEMVRYVLRNHMDIRVIEEPKAGGTAKAVLAGYGDDDDDLLIVYGDTVVDDRSLRAAIDAFEDNRNAVVLTKNLTAAERSIDWICADCDGDRVYGIYGHPRSHYVNARIGGVFVMSKRMLPYLKANPGYMMNVCVGGMPPKEAELSQSIQMMIEDGVVVSRVETVNYCFDIDKPWHLLEANEALMEERFSALDTHEIAESAFVDETALIGGKLHLGEGSRIGRNVIIKGDAYIGDYVEIDSGAILEDKVVVGDYSRIVDTCNIKSLTTIGSYNIIGFNAEVSGITFDHVSLAHNCEMRGIIGSYTDIAAGCLTGSLRFNDETTAQSVQGRMERPLSYSDAIVIGDHSRTGVGNIFFPGVKIGCNVALWPGAIIDRDVESKTLVVVEQKKVMKVWNSSRYGW